MIDYAGNGGASEVGNVGSGMMGNGVDAPVVRRPEPRLRIAACLSLPAGILRMARRKRYSSARSAWALVSPAFRTPVLMSQAGMFALFDREPFEKPVYLL